ncbi:MAG: FHA domain-containing protein, partial [Deltaproteobacteria bacterium]|nr:FHA domain-containing protein [Deltaproteobacteria bacterium]
MIGSKAAAIEVEEEKTTIDSGPTAKDAWDEGTSVEDAGTNSRHDVGAGTVDEPTVEDQARPLPPLSLVPPLPKSANRPVAAKLHVVSGNDTGRDFPLDPARTLTVGRAIDNDVVLTDIAVSRKHLDLSYDGSHWVLRDRGSGNGTLVNDRIEDGSCRLLHGDRIEIGNTVFQLDHPAAAADAPEVGWGQKDDDDEAATVAGRGNRAQSTPQAPTPPAPRSPASPTARLPPPNRARNPSGAPPMGAPAPLPRPNRTTGAPPVPGSVSAAIPAAVPVAIPSGPVTDAAPVASTSGPFEIAAITSPPQRHLTTTARVEPRALAAPARYPFIVKPPSPARRYAIYGGIAAGVLLVGIIAKFASGPAEPGAVASVVEGSGAPAGVRASAGIASGSAATDPPAVADRDRPVIEPPVAIDPPAPPAGSGSAAMTGAGSGSAIAPPAVI